MSELKLTNVTIKFDDRLVFQDLNLVVKEGETVCIKTGVLDGGSTLLKLMAGLVQPDHGVVSFGDRPLCDYADAELFQLVGMCFEARGLFDVFTNYNNLVLPIIYHQDIEPSALEQRIAYYSEKLELAEQLDKEPFQLNDVQTRLMNLLKWLIVEPKVLVVDEIQAGLSPQLRHKVIATLQEAQERTKCAIVMTVTAGDETQFAHRTYRINNCKLEAEA